jgi:hypothetical protein
MSVETALARMTAAGVTVELDGNDLLVEGELSDEQIRWLQDRKGDLIEALSPRRLWLIDGSSASFTPPASLVEVQAAYPGAQVAPAPEPGPNPPPLPPDVVATVNRWLDHIGEHHEADRAELLRNCAANPEALAGLLGIIAEAGIITASPSPEPTPEPVTCGGCLHFEPDRTGDGSGLGACRIDAPASRRPPALWPNAPHRCLDWSGSTANNDPHGDIEAKR